MSRKRFSVFIAGHKGMVGSSLCNLFKKKKKFFKIITKEKNKLNLLDQKKVNEFFKKNKIDYLFICAARVGGIYINSIKPADFIYENLTISSNLIHASYLGKVKKVLYLGSSCIYPKNINIPIKENDLLSGELEKTNEAYAVAKIAGIKLAQSYNSQYNTDIRCVMPNNLYGPNDNYELKNSHVIAALIRKFHEAKIRNDKYVTLWGSGKAKREILHVNDLSEFIFKILNISKKKFLKITKKDCIINLGSGDELTIKQLAFLIKKIVKYKGLIKFNNNGLDGVMRKALDTRRQKNLNLYPKISLKKGIDLSYLDFKNKYEKN